MLKQGLLFIFLLLVSSSISATEIAYNAFSFNLPGEWEIVTEQSGAKRAQKQTKDSFRAFIVSVYYPPSSEEIAKMLIYVQNYLGGLEKDDLFLKKESEFIQYKSSQGAPFNYIVYSDETHKGFFIGASLGSNAGVVLITYEGNGDHKDAVEELKFILETLKLKNT